MITVSLRAKILLLVGIIISVMLGTSTYVHIRDLQRDYLKALGWRAEALAQDLSNAVQEAQKYGITALQDLAAPLSLRCVKLYEVNQTKDFTHFAVIDAAGNIIAHNDRALWNTPVASASLRQALEQRSRVTILDAASYHTLLPLWADQQTYLGSIDIGIAKQVVDAKVRQILAHAGGLFGVFLLLAFFAFSFFMHILVTKPLKQIAAAGQQLAAGNLAQTFQPTRRKDEIGLLETAFNGVVLYLQNVAAVAGHIAAGVLSDEVQARSAQDVLGTAVHEMLRYLQQVAGVAERIAEGDLTATVQVRSGNDAFGSVIQAMTAGLQALIVQIRRSGQRLAATKSRILTLTEQDMRIVAQVHSAAEEVAAIMHEMDASVAEVVQNMGALSAAVEETSTAMSQMSLSIKHIVVNTNNLTDKTQQTIAASQETLQSLEKVVASTDLSKRLAEDTSQDALQGQAAVEQVMQSMATIQQTVTAAVAIMTRFEQRSQEIGTILTIIRGITEQTSLLALNASIIAAQAGVHGRGFAIVADEIKNLAAGVANSTKEIAVIVRSLQQDTGQMVQTIRQGADHARQGITRTQQAQKTLEKIIRSAEQSSTVVTGITATLHGQMANSREVAAEMERVNLMIADITTATEEQAATTRQINGAITHVNEMASQIRKATAEQAKGVHHVVNAIQNVSVLIDETRQSSQEILAATAELAAQSDILMHSVDRFELEASQ